LYISDAFQWVSTPEGFEYWEKIELKWFNNVYGVNKF
jgi:hypothetical protein